MTLYTGLPQVIPKLGQGGVSPPLSPSHPGHVGTGEGNSFRRTGNGEGGNRAPERNHARRTRARYARGHARARSRSFVLDPSD